MKLLFDRDQTGSAVFSLVPLRIGSGVTFKLTAELELDQEEEALLNRYKLTNAPLVLSDPIEDLKQAFRPGSLMGLMTFVVFWIIGSFTFALGLGLLATIVMTAVYFKTLREQIIVSDLLAGGRTFRCDSIIALIQKEAYLEGVCSYLRQVLESAKHWGDREAIDIPPLSKEAAKLAVLKAL